MKSKKSKKIVFTLGVFTKKKSLKLARIELKKLKTNQIRSKNLFSIFSLFSSILVYNNLNIFTLIVL